MPFANLKVPAGSVTTAQKKDMVNTVTDMYVGIWGEDARAGVMAGASAATSSPSPCSKAPTANTTNPASTPRDRRKAASIPAAVPGSRPREQWLPSLPARSRSQISNPQRRSRLPDSRTRSALAMLPFKAGAAQEQQCQPRGPAGRRTSSENLGSDRS
jgi:hypothetical protein